MKEVKWDSKRFIKDMNNLKKENNWREAKSLRSRVFFNTVDFVNQGHYETNDGTFVDLDSFPDPFDGTLFYNQVHNHNFTSQPEPTIIDVINDDCILVGKKLKDEGLNPVVLNMASAETPGGGCTRGSMAQEEQIFYRSDIFLSLFPFHKEMAERFMLDDNEEFKMRDRYPIKKFGGIYTPSATIFRKSEDTGYELMDEPFTLAFVSVAAFRRPPLLNENTLDPHIVVDTMKKIRTILRIGLLNNHDAIVLSAWGCGAYQNPPKHMAKLFHKVIEEEEFKNKYKKIVFAIIEDSNSIRENNKEGNFKPFEAEFN